MVGRELGEHYPVRRRRWSVVSWAWEPSAAACGSATPATPPEEEEEGGRGLICVLMIALAAVY